MGHAQIEWVRGLGRVAPMYLPVHFLPALLFKFKQIQAAPAAMLTTISLAALRSCVFLTSYQVCYYVIEHKKIALTHVKMATLLTH